MDLEGHGTVELDLLATFDKAKGPVLKDSEVNPLTDIAMFKIRDLKHIPQFAFEPGDINNTDPLEMLAINSQVSYDEEVMKDYEPSCCPDDPSFTRAVRRLLPNKVSSTKTNDFHLTGDGERVLYKISTTKGTSGCPILQGGKVVGMLSICFQV